MKSFLPKKSIIVKLKKNLHNKPIPKTLINKKWINNSKLNNFNKPTKLQVRPKSIKHLYKLLLLERQRLKYFYGCISNNKLKKLYQKINNLENSTIIEKLIIRLNLNLDSLLFLTGFFDSIFTIQKLILHKKILINNKPITYKNYKVNKGDIIDLSKINNLSINNNLPVFFEWNKSLNLLILLDNPKINFNKFNKTLILESLQKF